MFYNVVMDHHILTWLVLFIITILSVIRLCNTDKNDSQYHLLECEYLINNCENLANNINVEYEDIFENLEKQILAAKLLHEVLEKRNDFLENG